MCISWAIIDNETNIVSNTVMWNGNTETWTPPENSYWICIDGVFCGPGFVYDKETEEFTDPDAPEAPDDTDLILKK